MAGKVQVRRLYEAAGEEDGRRILIDGLWPRGVKKEEWPPGRWRPDLAPSRELREWYRHEHGRFEEFVERYRAEMEENPAVRELAAAEGTLTLVTATKDVAHSHAAVLAEYLTELRSRA